MIIFANSLQFCIEEHYSEIVLIGEPLPVFTSENLFLCKIYF